MTYAWPPIKLSTHNGATATLFEYGAHLTQWTTVKKKPWIFISQDATYEPGQPIRGGVPIVFPQFNTRGTGPKHGFLRNSLWHLVTPIPTEGHTSECLLEFVSNAETLQLWPNKFLAQFKVQLTDTSLAMSLSIKNTDNKEFEFNSALHTYFSIDQLNQTQIRGLDSKKYWDNGTPFSQRTTYTDEPLALSDAIDRVFFNIDGPLFIDDGESTLRIVQTNFKDTVVWNPGAEGVQNLGDLNNEEQTKMLCVEAAAIDHPIVLLPGETWTGQQYLSEL